MRKLPSIYGNLGANIAYVWTLTLFFFFFVPVFRPFEMAIELDFGQGFFFNVVMMMTIIFGTLLVTRTIFFLLFKYLGNNIWGYYGISIGELTMINYFEALYLTLMKGNEVYYFTEVAVCLQYTFLILLFPIIIYNFVLIVITLAEKREEQGGNSTVRFYDKAKQVKFAISRDAILYISAEENYIRVHYLDESGVKSYLLRGSMNSIAALTAKHGLCRCHRSYYVNPTHIKTLIKDKSGQISVELGSGGIKIPVSRLYYSNISDRI